MNKPGGGRRSVPGRAGPRRPLVLCLLALSFSLLPLPAALAHEGKPHSLADLPYTWGLDPLVIVSLALSGWLYFEGVRKLWREAGRGKGVRRWEAWAYSGG